jgi:YidC/Oxa1 family membrane protein insertase
MSYVPKSNLEFSGPSKPDGTQAMATGPGPGPGAVPGEGAGAGIPGTDPGQATDIIDLSGFVVSDAGVSAAQEAVPEVINEAMLTAADMGLSWYLPTGVLFESLQSLHGVLPWWGSIAVLTLTLRILLFPVMIKAQKNAAAMSQIMPKMQYYQTKISEARRSGNAMEAAKASYELQEVMTKSNYSMKQALMMPLIQAPIFISVFLALRGMATFPLESMKTGGLLWFTDLTLADPYYILPMATSLTLWAVLKLGVDMGQAQDPNSPMTKFMVNGLPFITFLFTMNFESAIVCYWATSNLISLAQVGIINRPRVRERLGIPPLKKWNSEELPSNKKGFKEGIMESWDNIKLTQKLNQRRNFQATQFEKAGIGPIKKTYKSDPTKIQPASKIKQ